MGQAISGSSEGQQDIEDTQPCDDCEEKCEGEGEASEKKPCFNNNLVGTVGLYKRHIITCDGVIDWTIKKLEKDPSTLVHKLYAEIKAQSANVAEEVKVTACSEPNSTSEGVDIYVYPDQIKYIGVKESDIPTLVKEHFVGGNPCASLKYISVENLFLVLVCTHGTRDKRCGRAGPAILEQIQTVVDKRNLHDKIKVLGSSHLGGHKYAGVITIYPIGDWYGYVNARNVEPIIDSYLKKHRLYPDMWRGRLGLDKDQQRVEAGLPPKGKK